ncbi:MAG: inositol monophosphatase family protein [Pseudomonadota bacterium]|nr:inositol monophosphatase family protein [Pseudomonadota bacterium]
MTRSIATQANPSYHDLTAALHLATTTAQSTAQYLAKRLACDLNHGQQVSKKHSKDVKLQADIHADQMITRQLKAHSDFSIISEESTNTVNTTHQALYWVIDPLDGTANYRQGLPSAVAIALMNGQQPILGVIAEVSTGTIYSGSVQHQAMKNQTPMRVSPIRDRQYACLLTGPGDYHHQVAQWASYVQQYQMVRMLGSAAVSCALVASGVAHMYHERKRALWDVAAGYALVRAAGGCGHMHQVGPYEFDVVLAGHPVLLAAHAGCFS